MTHANKGGAVLLFNPAEDLTMAKKKKKRRSGSKRKAAKRTNPAPKRRRRRRASAKRTNPAPKRRVRRRRGSHKRTNPAGRRRRRRNPSGGMFMTIGASALGGLGAYGAVWGAKKLAAKIDNAYAQIGIQAVAPFLVVVGAALLKKENIATGAAGAGFFQAPTLIMQGYNVYKATAAAQPANPGPQGLRGLNMGVRGDAIPRMARNRALG